MTVQRVGIRQIDMQRVFDQMDANPHIPFGMILLLVVLFVFRFRGKRER